MPKCRDCKYYPNDCGYWDKDYRKKSKTATFLSEDTPHNCKDFEVK